jgi:hypothetical protein
MNLGSGSRSDYRLYCLDSSGNINLAKWIKADNDSDAVQQARSLNRAARKCEVWQGSRLVASLGANDFTIYSAGSAQTPSPSAGGSESVHSAS